jgi:hypothetical protein
MSQEASRQDVEKVRDLFGLSHDLIAQATFPGHVASKVTECLQFLAFQYNDFKLRAEKLAPVEAPAAVEAVVVAPTEATPA